MIGAIEFMQAWRDMWDKACKNPERRACKGCPFHNVCDNELDYITHITDKEINDLITLVMAEKRRYEENGQ